PSRLSALPAMPSRTTSRRPTRRWSRSTTLTSMAGMRPPRTNSVPSSPPIPTSSNKALWRPGTSLSGIGAPRPRGYPPSHIAAIEPPPFLEFFKSKSASMTQFANLPDHEYSARDVFGIDTDMKVMGYKDRTDHVPPVDPDYLFDR